MPEMLRTVVSDLLELEPDMTIAGASERNEDPLPNARKEAADVLITHDNGCGGGSCLGLILSESPMAIFAISKDGHSASGVSLRRRSITLEVNGRLILADAIRTMAAELDVSSTAADGPSAGKGRA